LVGGFVPLRPPPQDLHKAGRGQHDIQLGIAGEKQQARSAEQSGDAICAGPPRLRTIQLTDEAQQRRLAPIGA
jgi:hypothetical protein